MKSRFIYILVVLFSFSFLSTFAENSAYTSDTLTMSPGYANDIFYSMSSGQVESVPRAGWDIAFYTASFSAGIIINEGNGVDLYTYPNGDTSAWAHVDTVGMSSWNKLINNSEDWENGAFNRNATGHPNYGWGVYNSVTHDVIGDSIYIIMLPDAGLKKIWIVKKISVNNMYVVKYANIDGTNEHTVELDIKPYIDKNFIYYSLVSNELIDREPSESWDILFTKYYDVTYDSEGNPVDYLVTGATSNVNRDASKFYPVSDNFTDWASRPFETLKNVVGYNWKSFDMVTFSWVIEDSTAFFVKDDVGDVYKLVFTYWQGATTGIFALNKEKVSLSSVDYNSDKQELMTLYPNPASSKINISLAKSVGVVKLNIINLEGRIIYNTTTDSLVTSINTSEFKPGLYFITIIGDNYRETQKIVIQ